MNGYSPQDISREVKVLVAPSDVPASVEEGIGLSAGGAVDGLRVDIKVSATSGAITYRLQQRSIDTWTDVTGATVSQSGDGVYSIRINRTESPTLFPLQKQIRVLANGAGSATVEKILLLQER